MRILDDAGRSGTNRGTRWPASTLHIGPGEIDGLKVAILKTGLSDRPDRLLVIPFGQPHPGQAIPGRTDDDLAHSGQQFRLLVGLDKSATALAQGF